MRQRGLKEERENERQTKRERQQITATIGSIDRETKEGVGLSHLLTTWATSEGWAPLLHIEPSELSKRGNEGTVKCGLESEIKLVLILTPVTCTIPVCCEEDIINQHASLNHFCFSGSPVAHFTFKCSILNLYVFLWERWTPALISSIQLGMSDGI